ncbi:3-hydroxyacyl-ACP dehydratase FabZ [Polaromonas sp.]|uniref:3-hydroxyacyl-ACP dehydratase FabZ n=1 Tax=Polaromonas sp. TaxID=1869339 RepID=UPI0035698828
MDIHEILNRLPHRHPFVMVDRVTKLEVGRRIEALKNVTISEGFFQGHFPSRPVMPGVLLLEALAQAAALLACETLREIPGDKTMYYFGGIDAARFKRPVEPGDQLVMDVRLTRRKGPVMKFKAHGLVGGQLAVEAVLLCTRVILSEAAL